MSWELLANAGLSSASSQEKFRETPTEETAELRSQAKANKAEAQRRKHALLAQMSPGWCKGPDQEDTHPPAQRTASSNGARMQASVETDTEESPATTPTTGHYQPMNAHNPTKDSSGISSCSPAPKPELPPPSLEKKGSGGYAHTPPARFARERVVTSGLWSRSSSPQSASSAARPKAGRSRKGIAVWYGDEVHIVDVVGAAGPQRARPHRPKY